MANSRDVAQRAGVSIASVSRAFHNDPKIKPTTAQRILEAARELNYVPNLVASGLKSRQSKGIGIVISDIENPFYIPVIKHMELALRKQGYRLIIMFDDGEPNSESEALLQMMANQVEGVLFTPKDTRSKEMVGRYREKQIRLLQLYTAPYEDLDALQVDDDYGVYIATRHLLQMGYRRILNVGSSAPSAFQRAFAEIGLDADPAFLVRAFDESDPFPLIKERIAAVKPDAVLAIADRNGRATIQALGNLSLRYPQDIGFMMYDDVAWVSMLNVTAIAHPIEVIADTAAHRILQLISCGQQHGLVTASIKPYVVPRGSTQRPGDDAEGC